MRKSLVAGNWKMNGSLASIRTLLGAINTGLRSVANVVDVVVCPSSVYIAEVGGLISDVDIALGAQNVSSSESGAFTGEVSVSMLADLGCRYVITGHSERRSLYSETDEMVADKTIAAANAGLTPIICVGELLEEQERGDTETVVARQLDALLGRADGLAVLSEIVIAYEPVWAIGTGKTATPEQAQSVHAFIRQRVAEKDVELAKKVRILYGGSVKSSNAVELFAKPDIDGGLIGGASLVADEFLAICTAAKPA